MPLPTMKILHVALNYLGAHQFGLERMLQSLGEYTQFDWMAEQKRGGFNGVKKMRMSLIALAKRFKPDFTFFQIQSPDIFDLHTIQQIPGFKVNWTGDVRIDTPKWYFDLAPAFDVTLFTNMRDVENMRAAGHRADYFQIGYDENIYKPDVSLWPEIVFMGNNYPGHFPLSMFRLEVVEKLRAEYGTRFAVFGGGWPSHFGAENLNDKPEREAEFYRRAKIGINISHFVEPRYSSDRILRIIGSGCLCISHHYPGIEIEFPDVPTFNTIAELIETVGRFIADHQLREYTENVTHLHVSKNHTWLSRANDIRRIYESKRIHN